MCLPLSPEAHSLELATLKNPTGRHIWWRLSHCRRAVIQTARGTLLVLFLVLWSSENIKMLVSLSVKWGEQGHYINKVIFHFKKDNVCINLLKGRECFRITWSHTRDLAQQHSACLAGARPRVHSWNKKEKKKKASPGILHQFFWHLLYSNFCFIFPYSSNYYFTNTCEIRVIY